MEVTVINLVLTVIVLVMGAWIYSRDRSQVALLIGTAFGLFAVSHLITLLNMAAQLDTAVIVIRVVAYLLAIAALYRLATQK